jgi:ABC-2 type transport system permease protein
MTTTFEEIGRPRSTGSQILAIYAKETYYELVKLVRAPIYSLFVIGFPLLFFLVFGLPNKATMFEGYPFTRYLIATYSTFGALAAALFAVGAGIAQERGFGWLELKRASAMPTTAYIFAKVVVATFFGALVAISMMILARLTMDPQITAAQAVLLVAAISASVLVFAALGIVVGLILPASSAPSTINFIYLPLSLFGGLWMPLDVLPDYIQRLAPYLPTYYASRLALRSLGYLKDAGSAGTDLLILLAYAVVFVVLAVWLFRRQEVRN